MRRKHNDLEMIQQLKAVNFRNRCKREQCAEIIAKQSLGPVVLRMAWQAWVGYTRDLWMLFEHLRQRQRIFASTLLTQCQCFGPQRNTVRSISRERGPHIPQALFLNLSQPPSRRIASSVNLQNV